MWWNVWKNIIVWNYSIAWNDEIVLRKSSWLLQQQEVVVNFLQNRSESHRQSVTFDISAPLLYKCDIIVARVLASSIAECAFPTCTIPMYCNAVAKVNFPGYLLCNKKQKWITESNVLFNFTPKLVKGGKSSDFNQWLEKKMQQYLGYA